MFLSKGWDASESSLDLPIVYRWNWTQNPEERYRFKGIIAERHFILHLNGIGATFDIQDKRSCDSLS